MAGRIARVLSFLRIDRQGAKVPRVKVEVAKDEVKECDQYQPAGVDSAPLPDDYAIMLAGLRTGLLNALGFVDTVNEGVANPGEYRIYSRDSSGAVKASTWLKNDGTVVTEASDDIILEGPVGTFTIATDGTLTQENDNGSITIAPDGTITLQGPTGSFTIAQDGTITGNSGGGAFVLDTGGNFTVGGATISAAGAIETASGNDVDTLKAKIDEIITTYNAHTHGAGPVVNPPLIPPL